MQIHQSAAIVAVLLFGMFPPVQAQLVAQDPVCIAAGPGGARACAPTQAADGPSALGLVRQHVGTPGLWADSADLAGRAAAAQYERPKVGNQDGSIPGTAAVEHMGIPR